MSLGGGYERRHSRWYEAVLLGWPFQVFAGVVLTVYVPSLERWGWGFWEILPPVRSNTLWSCVLAFQGSLWILRRMNRFPGAKVSSYILPTVSVAYLLVVAVLFFTREEYTRQVLFGSYVLSLVWFYFSYFIGRRYRRTKLAVVPVGRVDGLDVGTSVDARFLDRPDFNNIRYDGVVADLRSDDLTADWEKFLARCTLNHIPVYHVRQIQESISGRVEVEHLTENEYGSLLPSIFYQGAKRCVDFLAAVLLLPLLAPVMCVVIIAIRLDSKGPAVFVQERMGFRGIPFRVYKFRSMFADKGGRGFTEGENDPRITKVGKVIRKYRLDEIPQLFNVLKGEMSFIGPRPESMELSEWYERDVAFFSYRHVVRPGISGWAQVEQGYAAEVDGMTKKLQYDFYYIKHFSLWLDVLIVFKTIRTIFTGSGAR